MTYGGGELPAWATGTTGWHVDKEEAREHFAVALEGGINFFDTADVYSVGASKGRSLGSALEGDGFARRCCRRDQGSRRDGSRAEPQGAPARKHIIEACENSLRRLQMDYVDLYQIHRWDSLPEIEETLDALDSLVRSGKVRYLGASSMAAWQLSKALYTAKEHGWYRFVAMQNHYNLVYREEEREMIPLCMDQGMAIIPWSPLARGFLTGTRTPGGSGSTARAKNDGFAKQMYFAESDFAVADAVAEVAKQRGSTAAQVACAWVLQSPGITAPIIGATKTTHLKDLIAAVDLTLSAEEVAALEKPYQPHGILGHFQPEPKAMRAAKG